MTESEGSERVPALTELEPELKDLQELMTILQDKSHRDKDRDVTKVPHVIWFERLLKHLPNPVKFGDVTIPRMLTLLKECLLTQRYTPATSLITALADQLGKHCYEIQKTSLEVLYQDPVDNKEIIDQLVHQLRWLRETDAKSLVLEYVFFLLHLGDRDSAKQAFQMVPKKLGVRATPTEDSVYIDTIFKAYQGLVWYTEWKAALKMAERTDSQPDLDYLLSSQQSTSVNYEEVMKTHADRALAGFEGLVGKVGVWDIFITKHVEILEYYEKTEEGKQLLMQYRDRNPENPNSHKYLYNYVTQHGTSDTEQIEILKGLVERVPSDSLVLELCNLLQEKNLHLEVIQYMFDFLDYEDWMMKEQPWKILTDSLLTFSESPDFRSSWDDIWAVRKDWWPEFHFSTGKPHCTVTPVCEMCIQKGLCASFLLSKGSEFTGTLLRLMDDKQRMEFEEKLKVISIESEPG